MKSKDKLIAVVEKISRKENKSPETVVSELNNMSEEQINNKLKMINIFKEGGKLDYLLCLKKGGTVKDCGCGGNVEKKAEGGQTDDPRNQISWQKPVINGSDTTARGVNPYGQQFIARGTSDGRSLERITDTGSTGPIKTVWKQNPSLLDRILGVKKLTQGLDPILMQQDGGNLRRRDARENAAENRGMNRRQFRKAYRNAKNSLRENGPDDLRGRDLRQAARHAFDPWNNTSTVSQSIISSPVQISTLHEISRPNDAIMRMPVRVKNVALNIPDVTYRDPEIEMPQLNIVPPTIAKRIKSEADAWNQYQYERALFDKQGQNGSGNYRPDQRSAEYMHYMRDDFMRNAYNPETGEIREGYVMKTPTAVELNKFKNAGNFRYDVLPLGLDYTNETRAYEAGIKPDERFFWNAQTAKPGAIPATGLHDAAGMGASALILGAHTIPQLIESEVSQGIYNGVIRPTADELRFISPRLTDAVNGVAQATGRAVSGAGNMARTAVNGAKDFGNSLIYATENIAPGARDAVTSAFTRAGSTINNAGKTVANAVRSGAETVSNAARQVLPRTEYVSKPTDYANWGSEFLFRRGGKIK